MNYGAQERARSGGKGRGLRVALAVGAVILGLVTAAALTVPHMFRVQLAEEIPHASKRSAAARVAEMLKRTEDATNPPLELHLFNPRKNPLSESCDMNDGVFGLDGSAFDAMYEAPVANRAAATVLLNQVVHYWAGQPHTLIEPSAITDVVWRPDTPPSREWEEGQMDLRISVWVSPLQNEASSISLTIDVTGQCVPKV